MFQAIGYYRPGTGSAAKNLGKQLPLIAAEYPHIGGYHLGTLNVRFEPKLIVLRADHRTAPIPWDDHSPEVFDLVRVRLRFDGIEAPLPAFWYVAHRSDHRKDPHMHEFVGERFVPGLRHEARVTLECDRVAVELPYEASERGRSGRPRLARTFVIV
jgi:hypothetical protein